MQRVAPSVIAGQQLRQLLSGGVDRELNIVSALVETVIWVVVAGMSGARLIKWGRATGMSLLGCAPPRVPVRWLCRRCGVRASRFGCR